MCEKLLVASFIALICFTHANPASFITKCRPDDSKCAKESGQAALPKFAAGIAELNVDVLDPMHIDRVDAGTNNLKLVIKDATVTGLKNTRIKKLQRDPANKKLFLKLLCNADLDGQYEMNGQLLILPIEGKGKVHAGLKKAVINVDVDFEDFDGPNGKKHWSIKKWKHSFELKEKSDLIFENLFNGSEELGRAARDLVASSSNEIILEVGQPVIEAIVAIVVDNINNMFKAVPVEDLEL